MTQIIETLIEDFMTTDNITKIVKGLFTDNSFHEQPKGTYRFGLNAIAETDQGNYDARSNEESNEECTNLTPGYVPIGKVYAGKNRTILFSVSEDDTVSEIGIHFADSCDYVVHVNDKDSPENLKLGFSVQHQIQATYRLRRGCEDIVYWTDFNKRPRYFNFHKPEQFKNSNGVWINSKFNLQRTYDKIPNFDRVEVLDSGGSLEAGSYNFAIQYVDESLNPTEWITTSPTVKIYNDLSTKEYGEINGSINSEADYLSFPKTGKSIKLKFGNLDNNFLYYRIAIIASNNGSGLVNEVFYTETIPTTKDFFIFTGSNYIEPGTTEEILQFTDIIEKAGSIEQIENRLILGNTTGKQFNLCKLQKYASKVKADCIIKKVILNNINDPINTKNPVHEFNNGLGYMPGEIYSFGLVYIYEDNSLSPVYHIPGKNSNDENVVFSPSYENDVPMTFPMDINNGSKTSIYTDGNNSCSGTGYWGLDYNGSPLVGKPVRHHRFPLRSKINIPLVSNSLGEQQQVQYYNLRLRIEGNLIIPVPCSDDNLDCTTDQYNTFSIRVDYKVNGESFFFVENVDPQMYADGVNTSFNLSIYEDSQYHGSNNFSDIEITITDVNGNYHPIQGFDFSPYFTSSVAITTSPELYTSTTQSKVSTSHILGIKFSGIEKPSLEDTGGLKVIGYYIVRNERTEFEKTIIDSAVLFPTVVNNKYISHGLLQPENTNISKDIFAILHPEHKFNNKEYVVYDKIIQEGNFNIVEKKYGKINYDDVYDGSSYNSKYHKSGNDDGQDADGSPTSRGFDGWSFNLISRDNIVDFGIKSDFIFDKDEIKDRFYLDALGYKSVNDNKNDVYNIACDNKIGIVQFKKEITNNNLPYVVLYKENSDPYANFRILPYYKETVNPIYFDSNESEKSVFNGDTYISPMRYTNTVYWDNRVADRRGKKSLLKIILGSLLVVAGAVLSFFTAGASTVVIGAGITLIGAGALFVSSGIKIDNYNRAYSEEYEKGLRQTALDSWTDMFYNYKSNIPFGFFGNGKTGSSGPSDDTVQWINECITDLWFESSVNMNLRNRFVDDLSPTFLYSPWRIESGNNNPIGTWEFFGKNYTSSNAQRYPISALERHGARKLLAFDDKRDDNRYYIGLALGEYYNVNPDYNRRNVQKIYYHVPLEYDCCSDCQEEFPHRIHYSQQSFQEELSDNFRIFLPNNYRDIEGETGKVTNIYRLGMELYVHTEEALWLIPRNYQERITDQIVSFIGTAEYFSLPPRKIVDDDTGNSIGCQHKWSTVKTPVGLFFISENQNKIFQFDGKSLKLISNTGISSWFKNNLKFEMDKIYFNVKREQYPFRDNPSNPFGTGYISTYDSRKERILFTKKDFLLSDKIIDNNDFEICVRGGRLILFPDFNKTLQEKEKEGWTYNSIDTDCRLVFQRQIMKQKIEKREIKGEVVEISVNYLVTEFDYIEGIVVNNPIQLNNSWTLSYSLKDNNWISWHSFLPNFYINVPEEFFSWIHGSNYIWKHNKLGSYQNFYGKRHPFILEFVSVSNSLLTRIWNYIKFITEAKKYDKNFNEFVDENYVTFNKILFYNSRQCSGILNLVVKDTNNNSEDYLLQQVQNLSGDTIIIDKNEKDWTLNQFRDIRTNYSQPIFNSKIEDIQDNYFIDKKLNENSIDYNKDWTELEKFRDKYLVIRVIFDKFDDVKLLLNFSVENETQSFR